MDEPQDASEHRSSTTERHSGETDGANGTHRAGEARELIERLIERIDIARERIAHS